MPSFASTCHSQPTSFVTMSLQIQMHGTDDAHAVPRASHIGPWYRVSCAIPKVQSSLDTQL